MVMWMPVAAAMAAGKDLSAASPSARATWHLAVNTAARRALEAAAGLQKPDADQLSLLEGALLAAMLKDVHSHVRRADSLDYCRKAVGILLKAALDERMTLILAAANEQSSLPVQRQDVQIVAGTQYEQVLADSLAAFEKANVDALFEKVRTQAVAMQQQTISRLASPPPFDKLDAVLTRLRGTDSVRGDADWPAETLAGLLAELQTYAGRTDAPVLEEVAAYADGVAHRMADGIRQQYGRQVTMADNLFDEGKAKDARTAASLAAQVLEQMDAGLAALPADETAAEVPLPVYPVFTSVRNLIRQKAESIEAECFAAFIAKTPLLDIDSEALILVIESELAAHREVEASRIRLLEALGASRRSMVAEAYAGQGNEADQAHFAALLEAGTKPASVLHTRLSEGLDALLPAVRTTLADAQYAAAGFGALDALETLPDALLDDVHATGGLEHKTLAAALAFLERGGIDSTAGERIPENLLEETESRTLTRINALVATANHAIIGQLDLLRELEAEKLDGLKADVTDGRSLKAVRGEWREALLQRWQIQVGKHPSPYASLTPPVLQVLDKTVRQLYDSVLQDQMKEIEQQLINRAGTLDAPTPIETADATAIETEPLSNDEQAACPPPDAEAGTEQPIATDDAARSSVGGERDGKAERPVPDILLVLSGDETDRCNAALAIAGTEPRMELELAVDDPSVAADVLFAQLEPHLAALRENAMSRSRGKRGWFGRRRQRQPSISVHVVVESNAVRHRMSLLLKRRIEEALSNHADADDTPAITIDWQTGLTE
jgi:hypothetical protein